MVVLSDERLSAVSDYGRHETFLVKKTAARCERAAVPEFLCGLPRLEPDLELFRRVKSVSGLPAETVGHSRGDCGRRGVTELGYRCKSGMSDAG